MFIEINKSTIMSRMDSGNFFRDKDFEEMPQDIKNNIKKMMTDEEITACEALIQESIDRIQEKFSNIKAEVNFQKIITMNLFDIYKETSRLTEIAREFDEINRIKNSEKPKFYALDIYKKHYFINQYIIKYIMTVIGTIHLIKENHMGLIDDNIDEKVKKIALKNSLINIQNFLENSKQSLSLAQKLFDINFTIEYKDKKIDYDVFNENQKKAFLEEKIEIVLSYLQETSLNYINSTKNRYEFFEQIILAPIKIQKILKASRYSESGSQKMRKLLLNAGLDVEKIDKTLLNEKEFFKITSNLVISYCLTTIFELFHIDFFKLKDFYIFFYSENPSNTNMLKKLYVHVRNKLDANGSLVVEELLPFLHDDFKEIFYSIKSREYTGEELRYTFERYKLDLNMSMVARAKIQGIEIDGSVKTTV